MTRMEDAKLRAARTPGYLQTVIFFAKKGTEITSIPVSVIRIIRDPIDGHVDRGVFHRPNSHTVTTPWDCTVCVLSSNHWKTP